MQEKTKVFQFSIQPSLVERVKALGNGKFAAGLFFALKELDRLQGSTTKLEAVVLSPKGSAAASRNTYTPDPRLPMLPGETPAAHKKRLAAYIATLPETIHAKRVHSIERLVGIWNQHWGQLREDTGEPKNVTDYTKYESAPYGLGMKSGETIFDYITVDRMHECMIDGKAEYDTNMAEIAAREGRPPNTRKQLTPEALIGLGFKSTPADMSDEQIDGMNVDWAEGGGYFGHPPLREA